MAGMWLYNYDKLLSLMFSGISVTDNVTYNSDSYLRVKARGGYYVDAPYLEYHLDNLAFNDGIKGIMYNSISSGDNKSWKVGIMAKDFLFNYNTYTLEFSSDVGNVQKIFDNKSFEENLIKRNIKVSIPCLKGMTVYGFALGTGCGYNGRETLLYIEKFDTPQEFQQGDNIIIEYTQTFPTIYREA